MRGTRRITDLRPLTLSLLLTFTPTEAREFQVPEDFSIGSATDQPRVRFPMFAAFDDKRRLFVAESSGLDLYEELQKLTRRCRISLLEDTNGDGVFDKSQVFAERLVFPMGLVWRERKLYVADPPDLITLEDTDGDHRADKRTVLLTGFGHTDNGSLHGLTFGPDGWLYMTMGQPDGFRIKRADGDIVEGKSGALLRCRPDGSDLEVVCRGFENLVEVVFMPTGEIIGTDNWFFLPQDGVRDALVHLAPGGVYPLNAHAEVERGHFFSGELLPALQTYPAVAHSGLMRYTGSAFPEALRGSLFSAQFNTRKIVRHELSRDGSTFQSIDADFLTTDDPDFHPSDLLEDSDGSILVVDTGSWYVHHCPTGRIRKAPAEGGLYRIQYTNQRNRSSPRNWTAEIWAKARTAGAGLPYSSPADALSTDALALSLRAFARHQVSYSEIVNLLSHPAAHVRLAGAEALATTPLPAAGNVVPALAQALADDPDPFLRHGLIYALHHTADTRTLEKLLDDARPQVRRGAFILLDQAPHRTLQVSHATNALTDPALREVALKAFRHHPEWSEQAVVLIRDFLAADNTTEQLPALLELIPPFLNSSEVRDLVTRVVGDENRATALRFALVDLLTQRGSADDAEVVRALRAALRSKDAQLVRSALRFLQVRRLNATQDDLSGIVRDTQHSLSTRLEALRALIRTRPSLDAESFALVATGLSSSDSPALRLAAAETLASAELNSAQLEAFISSASRDRVISPSVVIAAAQRTKAPAAEPLLTYVSNAIASGWHAPNATLEWLERTFPGDRKCEELRASARRALDERATKLTALEPLLRGGDPNAGHQLFLGKLACSTCHRVGKTGGLVGPDLTRIGAIRSGQDLIESLVFPSATLSQGYDTYQVTLTDGETLTGVRVRQLDNAFVLRDSSGAEVRLAPSQIRTTERLESSLMPEGLISSLSEPEIRDLLAYLQSLK